MPPPPELAGLAERFRRNLDDYRSGRYKEARLRREFIDPFFKLLGWDVDNTSGLAEAYKDVIHEDAIKLGGGTKAPDYCFRVGGTRKFFVEAKKPSEDIKHSTDHAFQLRRYVRARLPVGPRATTYLRPMPVGASIRSGCTVGQERLAGRSRATS